MRRLWSAVLLLALVVSGSRASGASPRRDELLFVGPSPVASYNFDVLATGADGAGTRVVARNGDQEPPTSPRWSPDGRQVAVGIQGGLAVGSGDGNPAKLITAGGLDSPVGWSPDGRWIAFARSQGGSGVAVYIVKPSGTDLRQLYYLSASAAWAPGSGRLVLATTDGLRIVDVGGHVRAVPRTRCDSAPAWSPDGRWIAYAECTSSPPTKGSDTAIVLVHPDGTGRRWLTKPQPTQPLSGTIDTEPTWSPDSKRIAYTHKVWTPLVNHSEIRIVTRDGKKLGNIASKAADHDHAPSWSPDGTRLAFIRETGDLPNSDTARLIVAPASTRRGRVVAEHPRADPPSWRPR